MAKKSKKLTKLRDLETLEEQNAFLLKDKLLSLSAYLFLLNTDNLK